METVIIKYTDLGFRDYKETWDYQQQIHNRLTKAKAAIRVKGDVSAETPAEKPVETLSEELASAQAETPTEEQEETQAKAQLIFVEHPHVYTLGKSGRENNLLVSPDYLKSLGAGFYRIDRGGDITYHGPGQLVGYPVLDLDVLRMGVKQYVHTLEQTIIELLRQYDIISVTRKGATGVWLDADSSVRARKICAIGVRISRGITMHGFALNVNTELAYFDHINPCGFSSGAVTSMKKELGGEKDMQEIKTKLLEQFRQHFGVEIRR